MSGPAAKSGQPLPVPAGYQVVPATLAQTTSVARLAEFYYRATHAKGSARLVYPTAYFEWVERLPGANRYIDAVLIGPRHQVAGLALARPLTLGMWANMKLRSAIQEASAKTPADRTTKGWVRYLTHLRDRDLAVALSTVLPEEFYALRSAVVEFLEVDPELAGPEFSARQLESTLLDVLVSEARTSGYDYVLAWADAARSIPVLARAAGATAIYEELPTADGTLLGLVNGTKEAYRSAVGWVAEKRAALARIPARVRFALAEIRAGRWQSALQPQAGEPADVDWEALAREQRDRQMGNAVTLGGIRLRRIGSPVTPLDADLVEKLRDLIANDSERYALFPTYSAEQVLAALTPTSPSGRFVNRYTAVREADIQAKSTDLEHDVLAFAAEREGRTLGLIFGHRLPRISRESLPHEVYVIRAAYFAADVGPVDRADLLRTAADAARHAFGIGRTLYLRPAGLGDFAFSRYVLGARPASEPLTLYYLPLSERARAEEAILEHRLPVGYL